MTDATNRNRYGVMSVFVLEKTSEKDWRIIFKEDTINEKVD
jgi:hypothetical protein